MRRVENDCVGPCPQGCMGSTCPNRNAVHFYCDRCEEEFSPDELYDVDGEELCADCVLAQYSKISVD